MRRNVGAFKLMAEQVSNIPLNYTGCLSVSVMAIWMATLPWSKEHAPGTYQLPRSLSVYRIYIF